MILSALTIAYFTIFSAHGAGLPAPRGSCEQFLAKYIPHAEGLEQQIPLRDGTPGDIEKNLLLSIEDLKSYLKDQPKSPWHPELSAIDPSLFAGGKVIYISEIGPTLWSKPDLEIWMAAIHIGFTQDQSKAQNLIMTLAHNESVLGISPQSQERVRNAFLAAIEGHIAKTEVSRRQMNYYRQRSSPTQKPNASGPFDGLFQPPIETLRDPFTGEPENLADIKPEDLEMYTSITFDLEAHANQNRTAQEMRNNSPSLRIGFEIDHKRLFKMKTFTSIGDILLVKDDHRTIWIARMLLREALVRRKLVLDTQNHLVMLDKVQSDDRIFLTAAHPEVAPLWNYLHFDDSYIRSYDLTWDLDAFYLPRLVINHSHDYCTISIGRSGWEQGTFEPVNLNMSLTTSDTDHADCNFIGPREIERLNNWFVNQWTEYSRALGVTQFPLPLLDADEDDSELQLNFAGYSWVRLLGFYAFLAQKFPN